MKNIRKIVACAAILVFAVSTVGCKMIEKTPEAIAKTVVAKVGDKSITRGELDKNYQTVMMIEEAKQKYGEKYYENDEAKELLKQQKSQVLNQMAMEEAVLQEAEKAKAVPKEEDLNKEIQKKIDEFKKSQNIKDDKAYEESLKQNKLTPDEFKTLIKKNIIIEKYHNQIAKSIKVEDKEMQDYYNKLKDKYPAKETEPTKVHLAHILVETEEKAKEVKAKLDKGEDFAKLAKEYGTDGTKENGGDLGTVVVPEGKMDDDFMAGAMKLKDGQISAPVKTQWGYHLIKMIKREDKPAKAFAQVKEQIRKDLTEKKTEDAWNKKLKEIKDNAKIKIYEDKLV
ncbi:peptidylprolyl isomerase [Clostridium brassicae]|uniref:Foldase protein PrsA n=1 Tax=Clostridium brassicae TaxID=2999072 RepID=A0ABT4DDD1_9CLOT|nr:peptidylprolyl isomerase [Clostridium brassicae]MCY6960329.1 peptidylprolyl isomerase [Clostridium brassicae]